jgi:hypothetical protein
MKFAIRKKQEKTIIKFVSINLSEHDEKCLRKLTDKKKTPDTHILRFDTGENEHMPNKKRRK